MEQKQLEKNLADAGCTREITKDILRLLESGNVEGALQMMKKDRCRLMDELHESGRRIDCLDFLIRATEKEMNQ